jgi:DNA-binding transcriptional ArsR family regulator
MTRHSCDQRLDAVFAAIADPTRRAILATLADREARVGDLAERFPISLNAVSKHIHVLERAGLVERRIEGREHHLRVNGAPLRDAAAWLAHYADFWGTRLDALERLLVARRRRRRT